MPPEGLTTRTEIPAEVNNFYDRKLLDRAVPYFVHTKFAQIRDIPRQSGTDTIKFRKYGALAAQTTPLTEGVTPAGKKLSVTDITAQVQYYGDYIKLTDKVSIESIDPVLVETADLLGEQVGDSLDQICRNIMAAGTTIQYASTATARNEVASTMKLNRTEVKEMVRTLEKNNAKPVTSMVDPSTGYNTVPLNKAFIGIIHTDTVYDLDDATGWIPVEKYSNKKDVMENEAGYLAGVRFIKTTNAKIFAGLGAAGIDVYATLVLGQNAYAITRISGEALHNIVKPLGWGEDPLNQRATSGWKLTFVGKILQQPWIGRIEHAVSG